MFPDFLSLGEIFTEIQNRNSDNKTRLPNSWEAFQDPRLAVVENDPVFKYEVIDDHDNEGVPPTTASSALPTLSSSQAPSSTHNNPPVFPSASQTTPPATSSGTEPPHPASPAMTPPDAYRRFKRKMAPFTNFIKTNKIGKESRAGAPATVTGIVTQADATLAAFFDVLTKNPGQQRHVIVELVTDYVVILDENDDTTLLAQWTEVKSSRSATSALHAGHQLACAYQWISSNSSTSFRLESSYVVEVCVERLLG